MSLNSIKNSFKETMAYLATGGFLFYSAIFTFIGAALCTSSIGLCITAVIFFVAIDGTVFAKNIFKAIKNYDHGPVVELAIAETDLLTHRHSATQTNLIRDYFALKNYAHKLSENLAKYSDADKKTAKKNIEYARKHLAKIVALYRDSLKGKNLTDVESTLIKGCTSEITPDKFIEQFKARTQWMMASKLFSIAAGIFSAISAYFAILVEFLPSKIVIGYLSKLGITAAFVSTVGAPVIAVMAGLGSMLVMYGGASHMIKRGGGYKWLEKIKALTTENPDTPAWQRRAKKILMYAAFPVLTILSTASAAWSFCAPILKSTSNLTINVVLKIIGLIAWPFMIFLTLLFDTDNALESIQQVANDAGRIYRNISNAWQQETRLQFFNPFRQARLAFMACHAYCFGISTDNLPGNFIPPAVAAGPGAIMELATEWHYIFENAEPDEHNSNHAVLLEGDHLSTEDDEELPPLVHVPGSSNSSSTSCCDHDHDEADNDHDHGSILDYALRPFDYAAARWHWLFADRNYIWGNKTYSWEQAKRKFLPEKSMPDRPPLSKELSAYLMQQELAALEEEYTEKKTDGYFGTAIANKKASTFATLKKLIIFSSSTPEEKSVPENNSQNLSLALKTHESTLKENRYPLFSRTNPQAILSTQEIAADPFINEVCFNTAPACA